MRVLSYIFITLFGFQQVENFVRKTSPLAEPLLLLITPYWERSAERSYKEFFVREDLLIFKTRGVGETCVCIKVIMNLGNSVKHTEFSAVRYWTSGLWSKTACKYLPVVRLLNNLVAGNAIFFLFLNMYFSAFSKSLNFWDP